MPYLNHAIGMYKDKPKNLPIDIVRQGDFIIMVQGNKIIDKIKSSDNMVKLPLSNCLYRVFEPLQIAKS